MVFILKKNRIKNHTKALGDFNNDVWGDTNKKVSIGIFVYNEEKNIKIILEALSNQKLKEIFIDEIILVSSGSTDNTNSIVQSFFKEKKIGRLIIQREREGKASAINLFLKNAKNNIVVVCSGDIILEKNCIENLTTPFWKYENLGLTGVMPIPTNNKKTCLGYIIHYWWWMHNNLPRFGEMIAFRRDIVSKISEKTAVDEAYIEAIITKLGYKKMQISEAVVNNHGAENFADFVKQRRRIYAGHLKLKKEMKYSVQSFNMFRVFFLTFKYIKEERSIKGSLFLFIGLLFEIYSRILGIHDIYIKKTNDHIWDIAKTTKNLK